MTDTRSHFSIGTLEQIIQGYTMGYFPMADETGDLSWYSSPTHTLIPLDERFHIPTSLRRTLNRGQLSIRIDTAFQEVIEGCAKREQTWISSELRDIYQALQSLGIAHSFETWKGNTLAGGILGLAFGRAFIGESMFYRIPEGSKAALVYLVKHLKKQNFLLFDAQLMNPHLARFGAYTIDTPHYLRQMREASQQPARFEPLTEQEVLNWEKP